MISSLANAWVRAVTRPWTPTFKAALAGASHIKTLVGVVAGAVIGLGLSWLVHLLSGNLSEEFMGLASIWVSSETPPPIGTWLLLVPCGVVYGFYTFEIALFIVARLLGGKGSFGMQCYAQSLFYAPLAMVQQVLAVTPIGGRFPFMVVAVFSLLPTTTSLMAAHGYSTPRAFLTWIIPIVFNILVFVLIALLSSRFTG